MKKIYLLSVACLALLMVSCGGGGSSLSKKEMLAYIVEHEGIDVVSVQIPEELKSNSEIDKHYGGISRLKKYESQGLLTLKDTVVTYRQWGSTKSYEGTEIQLTDEGRKYVISNKNKVSTMLAYKSEYDKIVDMELLSRKTLEEYGAEIICYSVFYTSTVTETTPFASHTQIVPKVTFPIENDSNEQQVFATTAVAIFRNGDLIEISTSGKSVVTKKAMNDYSNKAWAGIVEKAVRFL